MTYRIIAIALLLATAPAFAQKKENKKDDKKFKFGFKGATTIGWIKSDDKKIVRNGAPVGFSYGFNFDYRLAKNFSFVSGFDVTNINMKMQNTHADFTYMNVSSTKHDTMYKVSPSTLLNIKARYIEIPLLFNGKTNEIGYWTYFIQGGFTPSVLISQKAKISSDSVPELAKMGSVKLNSESLDEYRNTEDDIALLRMGFVIAAGAEYNLSGNTSLVGSLRYNNGMFNVLRDPSVRFDKVSNQYFSINVGILF